MASKQRGAHESPAGEDAAAQLALFEALLARTPGLLWTADRDLRCGIVSGSATSRLGITPGTPIAASLLAGSDDAGRAAHRAALAGESLRYEVRLEGAVLSCLVEPLRDATGQVLGILGSAEDVTERYGAASIVTMQRNVFETMLDQSIIGIGIVDAQGRFLFVNAALRRFAQAEPAEQHQLADAGRIWGAWCADGRAAPLDEWPLACALRGETTAGREMYRDGPAGQRDHLLVAGAPVHDAAGTLIGAVVTAADITQRKQMEEETRALNDALEQRVRERTLDLERAQQTLLDFLDHSTAVIYLKDRDSRYLRINRHFEHLFNVSNADLVGRTDDGIFPAHVAEALRANDLHVLTSGESLHTEELVPTSGEDRTYLSVKFPLRDSAGVIYGICGISTDITERKRIEAQLQHSQATLTAVIESCLDPIWAVDAQLQLLAFNNAAARFIEAVIGAAPSRTTSIKHRVPDQLFDRWHPYMDRVLAGERFTVEESLLIKDVPRRLLVSLTPMIEDNRVTGVAAFTKDITELMRAEEQARQHQAELAHVLRLHTMGELAASLAHEVNQPLGAIANYAQGVRRRLDAGGIDPTALRHSVEAIAREALRAGEITRRVRELLRKEATQRAAVDVNAVVATALGVAEPAARQQAVRLIARLASQLPAIRADAIQIEQVVLNLVLNGIEAIGGSGGPRVVEVATAMAGAETVEICVRDSGVGIDPSVAARIFEPFLTTKPDGLGMGLAISRSIVDAHGGTLSARAASAGGTEFSVTLPVLDSAV
jgi:PAS domain S-box-containing protein